MKLGAQRGFPETNKAPLLNLRRASMPGFESRIDALAIHGFASHRRRTGALLIPGNVKLTAGCLWGQTTFSDRRPYSSLRHNRKRGLSPSAQLVV